MADITKIIDLKVVGTDKLHALEQEITKTEQKLKSMTKSGKKNAGMQKIHQKNINKTKVELKLLRGERNNEQKAIIASTKAAKKLDGSYNGLVARNKDLLMKMKAAKGGMNSNTTAMKQMKKEYTDNNGKLKEFDASLGNNQRNVGNYGSALGNMKAKLTGVGMAVGAAVVAFQAISGAVKFATKDFMEFESGMANIMSLMSGDDINKFGQELQDGAIDVMKEFGLETADMNKAMFDAVSAGIPAAEAVDFMRQASILATGGATDLTTAVDGVTSVINAFGIEASKTDEITSAFFSAQKFGKTTVEELSNSIGSVAPIAVQAGVGYKELLSSMAILTKQGIKTDVAATALRATMSALMKPAEGAKAKFDELGISYGASALQSEGLMNILGQISAAGEDNADVLSELIPNIKALTGVGALGTEQLAEYDEILQTVNEDFGENSSLAQANELQQKTLQKQLDRLNVEWREQKILLGESLKPIFEALVRLASFMIENLSTLATVVKRGTIAFAAYKVATFLASGGLKGVRIGTNLLTVAQKGLNVAMKANPIGLLVAGLTMLIPLLFGAKKETDGLNKEQQEAEGRMQRMADISKKHSDNLATEINGARDLFDAIGDENISREERGKLIDEVNNKYGTTLQNLDDEEKMASQLSEAYDLVVGSLKQKILAQQASEERLVFINDEISLEKQLQQELGNELDVKENLALLEKQMQDDQVQFNKVKQEAIGFSDMSTAAGRKEAKQAMDSSMLYGLFNVKLQQSTEKYEKYNNQLGKATAGQKSATDEISKAKKKLDDLIGTTGKKKDLDDDSNKTLGANKTAYQLLTGAVSDAEKAIHDLVIREKKGEKLTEELAKAKTDLTTAQQNLTKHTEDYNTAIGVSNSELDKELDKLSDITTENEKMKAIFEDVQGGQAEVSKANKNILQAEMDGIIAKGMAGEELTSDEIDRIGEIKGELDDLQNVAKANTWADEVFGLGTSEKVKNVIATMNAAMGVMDAMDKQAQVEFDNAMIRSEQDRETEIADLEATSAFKIMTEEQQAEALNDINIKYDEQQTELKRQEFERTKKFNTSQALIAGAMAIMRIAADVPKGDFGITTGILIAAQAVMTGMQVAAIQSQEFAGRLGGLVGEKGKQLPKGHIAKKYARGGMVVGKSHEQGGEKFGVGGRVMELEGGEAVINKRSTGMFRSQLSAMNAAGGGVQFANGGLVMQNQIRKDAQLQNAMSQSDIANLAMLINSQKVRVTETEITQTQRNVSAAESRVSF